MKAGLVNKLQAIVILCIAIIAISSLQACNSAKQVAYFQNVPDSVGSELRVRNTPFSEPVIHSGDILNIQVTTIDATINAGMATTKETQTVSNGETELSGYMVDKNGYIEMPIIGKMKMAGLTTNEAKEAVRAAALKYYTEPMVNVRIANFVITILGAVNSPGRYVVPTEKINIIDALGLAGDLSIVGKRGNVMLIREVNGESVFKRINLNNTDVFQSEYYYLQSGDKIYVEPLKAQARSETADKRGDRAITIALSVISVGLTIVSLIIVNSK